MLTLFTAIGHLTIQKNDKGTRIPIVKTGGQEYALSTHELYLWSSLAFQILTKEELQQIYHTQVKEHLIPNDSDFTHVLRRLLTRGIIVQGGGVTGVDALYRLFAQMHIVPVKASPFMRFSSCVRAWLHGHLPLTMLPRYLKKPACTPLEALILKLAEELSFSVAELLGYMEHSSELPSQTALDAVTEQMKIDDLSEQVTLHHIQFPILQGIANLYLRKQILLER